MNCPQCLVVILPTDRFCEECGTPLVADAQPMNGAKVCGKCGATDIDGDGYCVSCGFRNRDAAQDRFAVERSPYLAGVSDRGLKHHRNEDFLALEAIASPSTQILVVCDGVSSSQTPELASQTVAQTTCEFLGDRLTRSDGQGQNNAEVMQQAIAAALQAVSIIPYKTGANVDPPSTTLVAAIVQEREATIGWLGDSRAYWIAANASRQLTVDDSWLNDMVASGKMSEAQALKSPHAHAITSWLGADVSDIAKPSILNFPIPSEGYLLLCTDGLWNYVPEASQIFALMQQASSTEAAIISHHLVDFARSQGGHDNITVAVLYFT